jgi:hypothetical protein
MTRSPLRSLVALLGALSLLLAAAAPAAEPLRLDPPSPSRPLPAPTLLAPKADAAAVASWPALAAAHAAGQSDRVRAIAEAAVEASRAAHGERDPRTLDARLNQAVALLEGGDLRRAGELYARLINEASAAEGLRARQLEGAWHGLGLAALAAGNPGDAERAFAAALQAYRVEQGLHAPGQIGYLDAMTQSAARRARLDLADGYQLRRIELVERLHDERSLERADAAQALADWYDRSDRPRLALQAHAYRIDILTRAWGRDDPRLLDALLDAARAYAQVVDRYRERPYSVTLRNGTVVQTTEPPLATAVRLLKKPETKLTASERARLFLKIGDVHWIHGDRRRALAAWKVAAESSAATAERLSRPEAIEWPAGWPQPAASDAAGQVELSFTVSDRGRAKDIAQAAIRPADDAAGSAVVAALRKALGQVHFRPAIRAGAIVGGIEMRYPHPFQPAS